MTFANLNEGRRYRRPFFLGLMALSGALLPSPAHAANQSYTITSFESIRLDAPVRVEIVTGTGVSAKGEGDRVLLDRIDMQVSGRLLTIRLRPGGVISGKATLRLSTGAIARATGNGGGVLAIARMKGQDGQLQVSGNGLLSVEDIQLDRLRLLMAGGGMMTLAGKAAQIDARLVGPGKIAADSLTGKNITLVNDGAGSAEMTALVSASVTATGTGDTIVRGKAACKIKQLGSGRLECGGKVY